MLHLRPVLSPHAHARIVSIDKEAALAMPGVRAVLDASDLTHWRKKAASRVGALLARDEVMFRGSPCGGGRWRNPTGGLGWSIRS